MKTKIIIGILSVFLLTSLVVVGFSANKNHSLSSKNSTLLNKITSIKKADSSNLANAQNTYKQNLLQNSSLLSSQKSKDSSAIASINKKNSATLASLNKKSAAVSKSLNILQSKYNAQSKNLKTVNDKLQTQEQKTKASTSTTAQSVKLPNGLLNENYTTSIAQLKKLNVTHVASEDSSANNTTNTTEILDTTTSTSLKVGDSFNPNDLLIVIY
ncbi:hypothetical protein ACFO26_09980 [Lactococcus nasutitermitis]|uniref:PASTA domain-containing protein n=1 Tax=Lactococcus nasutitermitis TaxID=1652957 RepID=A0ABV9JFI3_9LACT|nr:hypothetical protein [Lactococcus nasutitermitis]